MKKKIINIALLLGVVALFTACELTTAGKSFVTEYAELTLKGKSAMSLPLGTPFTEPGFTAVEAGEDVTDRVVATGSVDHTKVGKYYLDYKVINVDGFAKVVRRIVGVYDASQPLCGFYSMDIKRTIGGKDSGERGPFYMLISKGSNADEYIVEDALAGWYRDGSAYGDDFAAEAIVKLNADNTITFVSGGEVPGFGDAISGIANSLWDASSGTLTFTTDYAGMLFSVTAKKL